MGELTVINVDVGITAVGWELPELTEADGVGGLRALKKIDHARQWWLGDLWNATKWGDGKAACKEAGVSYQTAKKAGWVASTIELCRRRHILSFNHHAEVCRVEDKETQDRFLDAVTEYKWSTRTLRDMVQYYLDTGEFVTDIDETADDDEYSDGSQGVVLALMAINQLNRILPDDTQVDEAIEMIEEWLVNFKKEMKR